MNDPYTDSRAEEYVADSPISLSDIVKTLRRYSGVIVLVMSCVALAYLIVATATYVFSPHQRVRSLPFRLEFRGATEGEYPNGLKFSTNEITATPVLLEVYKADDISRFASFDQFSHAVFVLELNRQLERLAAEYEGKLADPKLSSIERDRIAREYDSKRDAISKSDYTIQYVGPDDSRIPDSVLNKALHDILVVWARRAAVEKKALDYQVSITSPSAVDAIAIGRSQDYLVPLLLLRQRMSDAAVDAESVANVPGATLVRVPGKRISIADVRAHIDEILRFRIEPLIARADRSGASGGMAVAIMKAQLAYDQRGLEEAQERVAALRNALLTYESQNVIPRQATSASPGGSSGLDATAPRPAAPSETVMPQISDSFIDRIVDLTTRTADREYRQKLADDIKQLSLDVVPAQAAVRYDQEVLDSFKAPAVFSDAPPLRSEWDAAVADARDTITNLNIIYTLASRQLYPETEMYRVTGPAVVRIDRVTSPLRLGLYGILVLLIALLVTIVFAFLHNRVREEEAEETRERVEAAGTEPAPAQT